MHQPESVLENETQKILWDFEIQTDHLIPVRRPDRMTDEKKKWTSRGKKKKTKKEANRYCQRTKKAMKYEDDSDTNSNWRTWKHKA